MNSVSLHHAPPQIDLHLSKGESMKGHVKMLVDRDICIPAPADHQEDEAWRAWQVETRRKLIANED